MRITKNWPSSNIFLLEIFAIYGISEVTIELLLFLWVHVMPLSLYIYDPSKENGMSYPQTMNSIAS